MLFEALENCPGMPAFNPMLLLHGEQSVSSFRPMKKAIKYIIKTDIVDVQDKGKGALLVFRMKAFESLKDEV